MHHYVRVPLACASLSICLLEWKGFTRHIHLVLYYALRESEVILYMHVNGVQVKSTVVPNSQKSNQKHRVYAFPHLQLYVQMTKSESE